MADGDVVSPVLFADERFRVAKMQTTSPSAGGGASPLQGRRPVPIKPLAGGRSFKISGGCPTLRLMRKRAKRSGRCKTYRASMQPGTGERREA